MPKKAWDISNPLYRYLHKRKGYKRQTSTVKAEVKTKMPRRRTRVHYRSRPRFYSRFHRRSKMTLPVAPIAGLAAGFIAGQNSPLQFAMAGDWTNMGNALTARYTGFNPTTGQWDIGQLTAGLLPLVAGIGVHKVVGGWLGVNKMLGRAKVPIVRV